MKLRQLPIACSIGASARPRITEAAIMPPEVSSPRVTSQAPTPSVAICTPMRTALEAPEMSASCSAAFWLVRLMTNWRSSCRRVTAERMPMACTTSALRSAALAKARFSDCRCAIPAEARRETMSLATAKAKSTTAEPSASTPSAGPSRKISARKKGVHGASKKGSMEALPTKFRTCWRSWKAEATPGALHTGGG